MLNLIANQDPTLKLLTRWFGRLYAVWQVTCESHDEGNEMAQLRKSGPLFESKNDLSRDQLADLFQTFADRIRQGSLTLSRGAESVEITLPSLVRIEVEVEDKVKRSRIERELELEIKWSVDKAGEPTDDQRPKRGFSVT